MKGKVVLWKDDKGFGFIASDGCAEQVFFHISSIKNATRKPAVGDVVVFEVGTDAQGRQKATHVLLEGVPLAISSAPARIVTEPVKKDLIDYAAYFFLVMLLMLSVGLYTKTHDLNVALVLGAIVLLLFWAVSSRKKKPANPLFSCSKCRSVSSHDARTILAWNRGLNRLYCRSCHEAWLRGQPSRRVEPGTGYGSSKSGCLGLFLVIASFPIIGVISAVAWLS